MELMSTNSIANSDATPKYFTPISGPPPRADGNPVANEPAKKEPAVNLEYVPPAPPAGIKTAAFTDYPKNANVDVSTWPQRILERNMDAITARLRNAPSTVTADERRQLSEIEAQLSKLYAAERAPELGPIARDPKVEVCNRPVEIPIVEHTRLPHRWLKTSHVEAGMGAAAGGVPGHAPGNNGALFGKTTINNHAGESDLPYSTCEELPNVDEACVEERLKLGTPTGRWTPGLNDCHTVVAKIIADCTKPKTVSSAADAGVP
jgi:hypothetical protein